MTPAGAAMGHAVRGARAGATVAGHAHRLFRPADAAQAATPG